MVPRDPRPLVPMSKAGTGDDDDMTPERDAVRRIMVCTADMALSESLLGGFRKRGYRALGAADSDSALFQLAVAPPDAMLCDQALPGHEGMALMQLIRRERGDLAEMPIIVMSDFGDRSDIIAGKLAGADDFIVKPVDIELLVASVEAQLRLAARMRSAIVGQPATAGGANRLSACHALLDRLSFGVLFYDSHGQPIFTNQTAAQLTRANTATVRAWVMRHSSQSVRDGSYDPQSGSAVLDFRMIPVGVSRSNAAQHLFVAVLNLTEGGGTEPVLAAMIFPSSHGGALGAGLVGDAIGLTPTELRLAAYLAEGLRLDQIGELMGIAKPTVNYHLRNIYQKSGSSRQSDLINLLRAVHLVDRPGAGRG